MPTTSTTPTLLKPRRVPWGDLLAYPFLLIAVWIHRTRTRRELAELDEFQLIDTGIDPDYVWSEIRKPFWRA